MAQTHDAYCWKCCGKDTNLECSKCIRSFHVDCLKDENIEPWWGLKSWCCYVCNAINTSTNTTQMQLDRIPIIITRCFQLDFKKKNMKRNRKGITLNVKDEEDHFFSSVDIVNPIDLPYIKSKARTYTSLDEFLVDVQWFVHNCEISFTENHDKTKRAKKLLKSVSAEIESVKKCVHCHINANRKATRSTWFTMVCKAKHLIIWAYQKNARYWPAKLMSIDGDQVNVRFFGSYHKHENVPVNKCYLYSKKSPGNYYKPKSNDTKYKSALKEADEYIKNIREEYGSFELDESKSPFDPAAYNDYMRKLFSRIDKCPRQVAAQNGEENKNDLNGSMGNPSTSAKLEPSLGIEDIDEMLQQLENDDEVERENSDTDDNMETENGSIPTDNDTNMTDDDLDAESVSQYENSLQHFTQGFDRICKMNATLKEDLKRRKLQVETLEESNTKLVVEKEKLQNEHKIQIEALKKAQDQKIIRLKEEHQRLIEEQKQATMEQCKQEYLQRIEDAKKNKYCMGCDSPKPLDIYVCSMECQRRCWERAAN